MDYFRAIVQNVFQEGKHGPYAIATCNDVKGSITFSLKSEIWQENEYPQKGSIVYLADINEKRAGYRAGSARFFKPSDEQQRVNNMEFLFPYVRQYPFDETCENIVRELAARNWNVPEINVELNDHGRGERKLRKVSKIIGKDFSLRFSRTQGCVSDSIYSDSAAISEIIIPHKHLEVYENFIMSYYLYVGNDWENDKASFMNESKVMAKLYGKKKIYLKYKNALDRSSNPKYLYNDNDLDREYSPEDKEPKEINIKELMLGFKIYLEELLKYIVSFPIPKNHINLLAVPEKIPFPDNLPEIFSFAEYDTAVRTLTGQKNINELPLHERYATESGRRLIPLNVRNDDTFPEIAYNGFHWCGFGSVTKSTPIESLKIPDHKKNNDDEFVLRIIPKYANDIYVADMEPADAYKRNVFEEYPDLQVLTDSQYHEFLRHRGRTITPITEYKGDFIQPVVLLGRDLEFNEVEVVSWQKAKPASFNLTLLGFDDK